QARLAIQREFLAHRQSTNHQQFEGIGLYTRPDAGTSSRDLAEVDISDLESDIPVELISSEKLPGGIVVVTVGQPYGRRPVAGAVGGRLAQCGPDIKPPVLRVSD